MLSPRSVHLLLKYFDSIDDALSRRLVRRRVWDEEALTFLLTELLDDECQEDHRLTYKQSDLLNDLAMTDEPLSIDVTLDTHSYPKSMERYVTQSDIGFILSYQNQFMHKSSFKAGWLMQAKRLFHDKKSHNREYTTHSGFESINKAQHDRMKKIRDWAECDFIKYLLYCPRPSYLERELREHLSMARSTTLSRDIFDYTMGLELRDDLLSNCPTTAAGIFVAQLDSLPKSLLEIHKSIFEKVTPLSWFIVTQLAQSEGIRIREHHRMERELGRSGSNLNNPIINGLVRGDHSVIKEDSKLVAVLEDASQAKILPAHTLTVKVVNGVDRQTNDIRG